MSLPDFFENRNEPWVFEDTLSFIRSNFEIKDGVEYRVGRKINKSQENQRALLVIAYALMMDYTFNQLKALFAEHDHFAISNPESREGRNILEINKMYTKILNNGGSFEENLSEHLGLFNLPDNVLCLK